MKKREFLFGYGIPVAVALVLTAIACFFSRMYYDWYWISEWMISVPETAAYYLTLLAVFATAGVTAQELFFGKKSRALLRTGIYAVCAAVTPMLRYLMRHFVLLGVADGEEMFSYFYEDALTSVTNLLYFLAAAGVLWLERLFFDKVLKEAPKNDARTISPKHPTGMALLICTAALACVALIGFFSEGVFTAEAFLAIGLEVLVDAVCFFVACGASRMA